MGETVLLVGGGGREHAIARALADPETTLFACAGTRNPGVSSLVDGVETVDATDVEAVVDYATAVGATLAVVGPERPLEAGVVDALEAAGVYAFGPRQADARIETNKAFQRRFMRENGVPGCPDFETFEDTAAACAYLDAVDGDVAVKPAGLTGGKGVRVVGDQVDREGAKAHLRENDFDRVVVEERLVGEEFTLQAFVADGGLRTTPAVQDHSHAYEGDEGPNTGGMGSYSAASDALPFVTADDYRAAREILAATVEALPGYRGVLYGQFMLTAEGPKVVEFNARFGDPEAMNTLAVMETDLLDVLVAARDGRPLPELEFAPHATVCKYAVPEGYPTDPTGGTRLSVDAESVAAAVDGGAGGEDEDAAVPRADLCYASVAAREDGVYTTTSRAFAVVGVDDDLAGAEAAAEAGLSVAGEEGLRVRHDVGTEELVRRRVDHVEDLRS